MAVSISSTHPLSSIDVSPFSPRPWLCKLLCPLQLAILGPSKWRASSSSSLLLIFFFPFSLSELPPFHLSMFSIYLWNQRCLCSKVARNGRAENRINIGTDERKAFVHLCMCACDWCPMSAERQEKMDVTGCSGNWNKLWVSAGFPFLSSSLSLSLSHVFFTSQVNFRWSFLTKWTRSRTGQQCFDFFVQCSQNTLCSAKPSDVQLYLS